jgi:hypothetical protein
VIIPNLTAASFSVALSWLCHLDAAHYYFRRPALHIDALFNQAWSSLCSTAISLIRFTHEAWLKLIFFSRRSVWLWSEDSKNNGIMSSNLSWIILHFCFFQTGLFILPNLPFKEYRRIEAEHPLQTVLGKDGRSYTSTPFIWLRGAHRVYFISALLDTSLMMLIAVKC